MSAPVPRTVVEPTSIRARSNAASALPVLACQRITKSWNRSRPPILDAIDLQVPRGVVVGLQGANGAGKTTLLRILAGLFLPDAGTLAIDGLNPLRDRRAYQSSLGFLTAGQAGLYARMSVENHLDFWARLALLPGHQRRTAVQLALARFDLSDLASARVDRLSMGQRQRVRLAMAFLHNPAVVLLDEPQTSLDDAGIDLLLREVEELTQRGGCVVWCAPSVREHDLGFAAVYELTGGKLRRL